MFGATTLTNNNLVRNWLSADSALRLSRCTQMTTHTCLRRDPRRPSVDRLAPRFRLKGVNRPLDAALQILPCPPRRWRMRSKWLFLLTLAHCRPRPYMVITAVSLKGMTTQNPKHSQRHEGRGVPILATLEGWSLEIHFLGKARTFGLRVPRTAVPGFRS